MDKLTVMGILIAVLLVIVAFQGAQLIGIGSKLAGTISAGSSSNVVVGTTGGASVGHSLPTQVGGC